MNLAIDIVPLTITWWFGILIPFCIGLLIIQLAIRIPPDNRRLLSISLGIIMISRELWKSWYIFQIGAWEIETSLPLHLCGLAAILSGLMLFKTHQKGFEFLALIGLPGAIHALLTPQLNHGGELPQVIEYYIGHGGIILVPVYLAVVDGYRIEKFAWRGVFIYCQLLLIFIGSLNFLLGSNYMFLCSKPIVNSPMIIGSWPWYILGFEILGLGHILLFYLIFRRMKPLPY
jgi:hypothetical integral membrane protein (TIGR02206 family)